MKNHFYAVQVTLDDGTKLLCWRDNKKRFNYAKESKGYKKPLPPTLFNSKKEAQQAIDEIPSKGGNLKQFETVIGYKKTSIVKVFFNIPTVKEAGIIAVENSGNLTDKESAFFIAGFQECVKYINKIN